MTTNEKINEVLTLIAHLNYQVNTDSRDFEYVEEWIEELKNEPINEERIYLQQTGAFCIKEKLPT